MRSIWILLMIVSTVLSAQMQEWFMNRVYQPKQSYEVIGYGMGESLQKAMLHAKEDIAGQLFTEISSTKTSRLSEKDGKLSKSIDIKIDAQVHTVLSDIKPLRMEPNEGMFYVALLYENLKLSQRFAKKVGKVDCVQQVQNPYIVRTPMYLEIKEAVGCDIDFTLERKDKVWYVSYQSTLVPIAPVDYEDLFISSKQSPLAFTISTRILREGQAFYFTVQSTENGYVTLLDVYANGITAVVEPSFKIEKDKAYRLPPKESETYFEAGVLNAGQQTHDLYVAFLTQEPINVSRFEMTTDTLVEGEAAYKADELLDMTAKYPFTTLFVRTKPR
ncbi:MAG: hypothetical protein DRG24_00205 [Epsilonproteobacteria bacterium]|nr:MAG: hypothetical protein DRG24_00205 [Campylobacterota bacterium]